MRAVRFFAACLLTTVCVGCAGSRPDAVSDLPEWKGRSIQEMIDALGKPSEETEQTVGKMPTKGWNHGIVFSAYPRNNPKNLDIVIKMCAWKQGDYRILACCDRVEEGWVVMGALRVHEDVQF